MARLAVFLLRVFVMTMGGILLAGATLTLAAERVSVPRPVLVPAVPKPKPLLVPDVSGQAYVFAKGILQDAGFAWHVAGAVQGFAANTVVTQDPVAGTTVVDTGAPTVTLTLQRDPTYGEHGTPDNDSPYSGTPVQIVQSGQASLGPKVRLEPVPVPGPPQVTPTPTVQLPPPTPTPTTPKVTPTTPAATVPVTPQAPPATTPSAPATPPTPTTPPGTPRPPDFTVPGAPKEPAQLQPLPDRALALSAWLDAHRQPTAANLNHWLYEHAFIVAGAKFGWWHGAQALQILIGVDQRAEKLWGVGKQSETAARAALAEVQARKK